MKNQVLEGFGTLRGFFLSFSQVPPKTHPNDTTRRVLSDEYRVVQNNPQKGHELRKDEDPEGGV